MNKRFMPLYLVLALLIGIGGFWSALEWESARYPASTDRIYYDVSTKGFTEIGVDDSRSQSIRKMYELFQARDNFASVAELENIKTADMLNIYNMRADSYQQAHKAFRDGRVHIVTSAFGNATRLGSPPGGKSTVTIAKQIDFLTSQLIEVAVTAKYLGVEKMNYYVWLSPENLEANKVLLDGALQAIRDNSYLSKELKQTVSQFYSTNKVGLIHNGPLFPVIDAAGNLTTTRFRNRGAGDLIPTMVDAGIKFDAKDIVVFSNIDNQLKPLELVAASFKTESDLMQVHVKTDGSGGTMYWLNRDGVRRLVPLESIDVPREVLDQTISLNTNTIVMRNSALNAEFYDNIPFPFEKKTYDGVDFWLPKLSLSDVGKDPRIKSAIALGDPADFFFTGSKDFEKLTATGEEEIKRRIRHWIFMNNNNFLDNLRVRKLRGRIKDLNCSELLIGIMVF